jgi:hypothetical protein
MYRYFYYGEGLRNKIIKYIGKNFKSATWMDAFGTDNKKEYV